MSYEEFRDKVTEALKGEPRGLTWTEIKTKFRLPQRVPNNKWAQALERDIGLIREKRGTTLFWRLK